MFDAISATSALTETSVTSGAGAVTPRSIAPTAASETPGADFGAMLSRLATDAASSVKNAEAMSLAGVRGQATVQQVVEAVMTAEQSLQGAIAIRDKVVGAYLEISRMQI